MKNLSRFYIFYFMIFCLLFLVSCAPKNPGTVSLVNTGIEPIKVSLDGRSFNLRPANHISKKISEGDHMIALNGEKIPIKVIKDKTTLFDSTGLACFVVADFTNKEEIKIEEKFVRQRTFTTQNRMATIIGWIFPEKPDPDERLLRLHQVDCEIIDDDSAIAEEISG